MKLLRNQTVADAFVDAVVASGRASTSNDTGIVSIFNNQPGWSKDSIMQITFGIVGTMLGVAAVWLSVYPSVRRYQRRTNAGRAQGAGDEELQVRS